MVQGHSLFTTRTTTTCEGLMLASNFVAMYMPVLLLYRLQLARRVRVLSLFETRSNLTFA